MEAKARKCDEKMVWAISDFGVEELMPESQTAEVEIVTSMKPSGDGGWLWTPPLARQLGFGRNPFRDYPDPEDPRLVSLIDFKLSERHPGKGYWEATFLRMDGVPQELMISCASDACDRLFLLLPAADKVKLSAPWEPEA